MFRFIAVLWLAFCCVSLAPASPPLESSSQPEKGRRFFIQSPFEVSCGFAEPVAEFDLPFANPTGRPLRVLSVETTCSCMKVSAKAESIPPGGTGAVHCIFQVPNAIGPIQKPVILRTDAAEGPTEVVMVRVDVPSALRCEPERLTWLMGSQAVEKTIRISVAKECPLQLKKVECSRDVFDSKLDTITEGREYVLRVTPRDTKNPTAGMLLITTDSAVPRQRFRRVQLAIESPAPGASPSATPFP